MTSSWWHSRHRETFHNYRRRMPSSEWFSHQLRGQERAWVSVERVLLVFSLLLGGHDCSVKCAIVLQSAPTTADSGRGCYRTGGSLPVALGENGSRPQRNLFPFSPPPSFFRPSHVCSIFTGPPPLGCRFGEEVRRVPSSSITTSCCTFDTDPP